MFCSMQYVQDSLVASVRREGDGWNSKLGHKVALDGSVSILYRIMHTLAGA